MPSCVFPNFPDNLFELGRCRVHWYDERDRIVIIFVNQLEDFVQPYLRGGLLLGLRGSSKVNTNVNITNFPVFIGSPRESLHKFCVHSLID